MFSSCDASQQNHIVSSSKETEINVHPEEEPIRVGAERLDSYLQFIENKKVGLVANQSSRIGNRHLVDSLITRGVQIEKIFTPEHGFRGKEDAGALIENSIDPKTKLPLISLYGKNKKPNASQVKGLEVLLFDLQDVGVRFYTYLSTLHYIMQTAAENGITVVVLDRPNPHMDVVDGPVMDEDFMSFVGLHPVPLLYGMSIGEYARMINKEGWLGEGLQCQLVVIACENLKRNSIYDFPIAPSPNLPNMASIDLYPSLALFEGTTISVGRGTNKPFQQIGHPLLEEYYDYSFTPQPTSGAKKPKMKGKKCYGIDLSGISIDKSFFDLKYLLEFYNNYPSKEEFFNSFFRLLAGTDRLEQQIQSGKTEAEIRESWKPDLESFKSIRKNYLLYR